MAGRSHTFVALILAACAMVLQAQESQARVRRIGNGYFEGLQVDLHSVHDEVTLYRGGPHELLVLQVTPRNAPGPDVDFRRLTNRLLIRDATQVNPTFEPEAEVWDVQVSPIAATSFTLLCEGGSGVFDFTLIPVEELVVQAISASVRVEFPNANSVVLNKMDLIGENGVLVLTGLLNARVEEGSVVCSNAHCKIDVDGVPSEGETRLSLSGEPAALQLTLPREVSLRVNAPAAVLSLFESPHLEKQGDHLESPGFQLSPTRLHLEIAREVRHLEVLWTSESQALAEARPRVEAKPEETGDGEPAPSAAEDEEYARLVASFLASLNQAQESLETHQSQIRQAEALLAEIQSERGDERRLPTFMRWIEEAKAGIGSKDVQDKFPVLSEQVLRGSDRFHDGLNYYLMGQLPQALQAFREARRRAGDLVPAEAWIRKTQSEIDRLYAENVAGEPQASNPETESKIEGTTPVFAIQNPVGGVTSIRDRNLVLTGQVADDRGVDRIEITLNGATLVDAQGKQVVIRPADGAQRRLSFSTGIELRKGENQVVLTAHDIDTPPNWTSESFTVIRKPPIYQTSAFAISSGSVVLLALLGYLISRAIKYRIAIANKYNPYIAGAPIRDETMLFGRDRVLRTILNTVHHNSIMIHGPRRIGKTSLMHELKRRLESARDPEYTYVPVMIDLQGTPEERFFEVMMREVLEVLQANVPSDLVREGLTLESPYSGWDFSRDIRKVIGLLKRKSSKTLKLVLLLDEVDELNRYSEKINQRLRSVFMKTFAENLVTVMAGAHVKKDWESEGSPWYNFFEQIEIRPLEREDAVRLITNPVKGIFSYDQAAITKILEYSNCEPYAIQRICVHAINVAIERKSRRVLLRDIEAAQAMADGTEEEAA